jgi:SRSO17 transposase
MNSNTLAIWARLTMGLFPSMRMASWMKSPCRYSSRSLNHEHGLKAEDRYKPKPQMAIEHIQALQERVFHVEVVLADSLYGESTDFIEALCQLKLQFVVAIRENHGIWMPADQRIRYTPWQEFDRTFTDGETETRWIREIIYGQRQALRYYQITTDTEVE